MKAMVAALGCLSACADAPTPFEFMSSASGTRNTESLDSAMFEGHGSSVDDMYPDFSDARGVTYRLTVTRGTTSTSVDVVIGDECGQLARGHDIGALRAENRHIAFDNSLAMDSFDSYVICVGTDDTVENDID